MRKRKCFGWFLIVSISVLPAKAQQEIPYRLRHPDGLLAKAANAQQRADLLKAYGTLYNILHQLSLYRSAFLTNGNFVDLFPTAYYHTTYIEMESIAAGAFAYPMEKMRQMVAFFDAYAYNRRRWDAGQKTAVEPHWKVHFQTCEEASNITLVTCFYAGCVLATAVEAHVACDLPRAIKHAYQNRYDAKITSADARLSADFNATDDVFRHSLQRTLADLSEGKTGCSKFVANWLMQVKNGRLLEVYNNNAEPCSKAAAAFFKLKALYTDKDVIAMRHGAWSTAFALSQFKDAQGNVLKAQPVLQHTVPENFEGGQVPSLYQKGGVKSLITVKEFTLNGNNESVLETGISINNNDYVFVQVGGSIVTGSWLGKADGSGLVNPSLFSGRYNKYKSLEHGSVVLVIGDEAIGCKKIFRDLGMKYNLPVATPDYGDRIVKPFFDVNYIPGIYFLSMYSGKLQLDINDNEPGNNSGAFKVRVFVLSYEAHRARNDFNWCPLEQPESGTDCQGNRWKKESLKSWWYHGINDSYRGEGTAKGCQCVYDEGELITARKNQGTFDIGYWIMNGNSGTPDADYLHLILDVIPHDLYEEFDNMMEYNATNGVKCKTN